MSEPVDVLITGAGASGAAVAWCLAGGRMLVGRPELRTAYLGLSGRRTYTTRWAATDYGTRSRFSAPESPISGRSM